MTGAIAAIPAKADDCSNEKALKSPPSSTTSEIDFQNRSNEKRRIYWVDQDGDRKFYGVVEPGNIFKQPTLLNHAWVVTDDAEKCLYTFVATAEPQVVDVGESAAAVAPPPPGGQQPIAQQQVVQQQVAPVAPPPPPAPVVQAVPSPAVADRPGNDPTTIIASTEAEPLPQVSPVEQFQLNGAYRLVTQLDAAKVLNSQASGTIEVVGAKPEWDSAQWVFEPVRNTPFVRIKNAWKGTYLADFNGKPRAMPAAPDATQSHWTFEPVDGTPFVQFRNRETDRFLLSINDAAALLDDFRADLENNSHWRLVRAGAAVAAPPPPPQRPLYDAAAASCREVGGYWTGSSCRRPVYITERLACPRGFVWAEETGECLWDGGSCPPWQTAPGGICGPNLVCRGGAVAPGPRGYPACYCPPGRVAWGDYPSLTCVPSVARVAPYLLPVVAAGVAVGIISGGKGRPQIGTVFGNSKACPTGQTGTPPNCVVASACPPGFVQGGPYCVRQGTIKPPVVPVVGGTKPTGVTPTQPGGTTPVVTNPQTGGGGPTATPVCSLGQTLQNGVCVNLNQAITCTGGKVEQGVCGCPQGTRLTGGGNNFQCVATQATTPTTQRACNVGEVPGAANCECRDPLFIFDGKCAQQTLAKPGTPTQTRSCNVGEVPGAANCECRAPFFIFDNKCAQQTLAKPGTPTQTRSCNAGEVPGAANCECRSPLQVSDGKCQTSTTQPVGGPPLCTDGQNTASGCRCAAPLTVLPGGKCGQPTKLGAQCLEGQNIAATGCVCGPPLKPIENGFCGRLLLNETRPLAKGGTCAEGADIKATGCQCNMNTVDAGGGKFICSANAKPAGGGTTTNPAGGPPLCTDGQNTASGCRCAAPLTVLPGGKCGQPTKAGAQCLEGQNIAATGCVCGPPLKPIENGYCGRLLLNETKPLAKGGNCAEGQDIKATNCLCNMKTVDVGGGKFICSANAAAPGKPGGALAPAAKCPDGTTGTPPNCVSPKLDRAPAKCPDGTTGTPPNCRANPPPSCPAGTTGTPPNCKANPPPSCPSGTTGTPPNCKANPPPSCPSGTTGTPPNCKANPPPSCPSGTTGTPPNCKANTPANCPAGTTGIPPNCRPAQTAPQPQPKPTVTPPACAPPKKLLPNGQCV